ncbi:MAG: hypothetical protein M3N00_00935, partial [Actinomycetota bacterium]|nr:hypothetical protein [Actinomycetota bacterium]
MKRSGASAGTPLRVLLVEDSEDDTLLLLRELRRGGYEPVYERVDAPEGMEWALDRRGDTALRPALDNRQGGTVASTRLDG